MSGVVPQLGLVGVLVLVNAAFAGTEMALVSLRDGQLQDLERRSATGALLVRLARDPNRFLATIQVGITLAGFLASAAAAVALAEPLRTPLGVLGSFAEPAAIVVVTLALAYVTLVFGELAPKRLAMQRAEKWALLAARPLTVASAVARPAVWLLSRSTDLVVRLLGADPSQQREEVSEQELRDLVAAQEKFTPRQKLIIEGAFEISERTLREVLRPRPDVFVLDETTPVRAAPLGQLAVSGHSRAPVAPAAKLDDVVGVVHLRDLLADGDRPVGAIVSEVVWLPETLGVLDALHELQLRREQLAVVVDEHGAAAGIITIEDLVEELVGEIYDETDRDILAVVHDPDGSLIMPGQFPVHDLPDIGISVPDGPYATVAGLVLDHLGRIPDAPGDRVEIGEFCFEILAVTGRAITKIRAIPAHPALTTKESS